MALLRRPCPSRKRNAKLYEAADPLPQKTPFCCGESLDFCNVTLYSSIVIQTFAHKGLEEVFRTGSKAGIQPAHATKLRRQLAQLDQAAIAQDMNIPGWGLHPLKGDMAGHWLVWVNGNWRLTFRFKNGDAELVNYQDYH